MSTLSQFMGGGSGYMNEFATLTSGTFVTPVAGKYLLTAIGGGGSSSGGINYRGGGGGGLAQSLVTLAEGVTLTYTCGASGGTTNLSGAGFTTLTANGGAAGNTTTASAGGTATGGTVMNVTGGRAGNVAYSGGGAVGVYGFTPPDSGAGWGVSAGSMPIISTTTAFDFGEPSRLLLPRGGTTAFFNGSIMAYASKPGQGGTSISIGGGLFSGGFGLDGTGNSRGGQFGGGAGGGQSNSAGGLGGVIIEWFTPL